MNSRRKFLQTATGAVGGFVFATAPDADAKEKQIVTILHGVDPPTWRQGVIGDFYSDVRSHSVYGPKRATGWGRPTSMIGPRGRPGAAGAAGQPGAAGASGSTGTVIDGGSL